MITLKDIAKAAGVTAATVSRALNNEPGVKDRTRTKIIALAKEMNYLSGPAAKRKAETRQGSIGVLWNRPYGLFFNHLCLELQRQAALRDHYTIVSFAKPDEALRHFNDHLVDKAIYWCGPGWKPSLEFLQAKQQFRGNMLMLGGASLDGTHRLEVDRKDAMLKAVRHLAGLGHRRIAFVGSASDKQMGYTIGLLENQLEYDPDFLMNCHTDIELSQEQVAKVLRKNDPDRATAVIVDSHGNLFSFIQAIRKLGLRVPEDFSLIVYESIPETEKLLDVPITYVGPNVRELAERSIGLLLGDDPLSEGEWHNQTIYPELIVRHTTATPPG
ncbi:LacI family DNA-binding transcriptional regulator [Paenibacillus hodogayensis]|uniref:LacI family DNA-binding transcriptional regulator n=1 Tax=Paenibacillus hodogayensis TaxID=279208 RepID=A0ABV5W600_9BACL